MHYKTTLLRQLSVRTEHGTRGPRFALCVTWNEENIRIFWWGYRHFFDAILDDASAWDEGGDWDWDWDRVNAHFDTIDWSDPYAVARTWTVVLEYLRMDYRYLYL